MKNVISTFGIYNAWSENIRRKMTSLVYPGDKCSLVNDLVDKNIGKGRGDRGARTTSAVV